MILFSILFIKSKKQKLRKVLRWFVLYLNKKRFIKSLSSCKYVNPLPQVQTLTRKRNVGGVLMYVTKGQYACKGN